MFLNILFALLVYIVAIPLAWLIPVLIDLIAPGTWITYIAISMGMIFAFIAFAIIGKKLNVQKTKLKNILSVFGISILGICVWILQFILYHGETNYSYLPQWSPYSVFTLYSWPFINHVGSFNAYSSLLFSLLPSIFIGYGFYYLNHGIKHERKVPKKTMTYALCGFILVFIAAFSFGKVIGDNIHAYNQQLDKNAAVTVVCEINLDSPQVNAIEHFIKDNDWVDHYRRVSKRETFELARDFYSSGELPENYDQESKMPVKFNIVLKNFDDLDVFCADIQKLQGIMDIYKNPRTD